MARRFTQDICAFRTAAQNKCATLPSRKVPRSHTWYHGADQGSTPLNAGFVRGLAPTSHALLRPDLIRSAFIYLPVPYHGTVTEKWMSSVSFSASK